MSRLNPEELDVVSFDTGPEPLAGVVPVPETQEPDCWSPLCVPTFWKTCETNCNCQ